MKIKTKLKFASLFIISFSIILLGSFQFLNHKEDTFSKIRDASDLIANEIADFNILINSYVIKPKESTYRILESNLYFLNKEIRGFFDLFPKTLQAGQNFENEITFMHESLEKLKEIHSKKVFSVEQQLATNSTILSLTRDLLITSKDISIFFFQIEREQNVIFHQTHNLITYIIISFLIILALFITWLVFTFNKMISKPIEKLTLLSAEIQKGAPLENLNAISFDAEDEITELSDEFKEISNNLKQAKTHIRIHKSRYALVEKITNIVTWEYNVDQNHFTWSENILNIFKLNEEKVPKTKEELFSYIHPEDKERLRLVIDSLISAQIESFDLELKIILPRHNIRWIETTGGLNKPEDNQTIVIGIIRDITKRKEIEMTFQKQRYSLMKAQEMGKVGSWELVIKEDILTLANEAYKILDLPLGIKLNYETFINCVHPEDKDYVQEQWLAALKKKPYDIEHRIIANGKTKWVREKAEFEFDYEGTCIKATGFVQDITSQKNAEQALKDKEEQLRNIIENSTNLFYSHTADHKLTYVSPQSRQYLDCEPEEAMIKWTKLLSDNPINQIGIKRTEKALQTGIAQKPYELELRTKKGRRIWVEVHEAPVISDGNVTEIVGSLTDITEKKLAQAQLIKQYNLLNAITENSTIDAFYCKDLEGRYLLINNYGANVFGLPKEQVLGKKDSDMLSQETARQIEEHDHKIMTEKIPQVFEETLIIGKKEYIFLASKMPYYGDNEEILGVIGISRNIAEIKKTEKLIRESEQKFKELFNNMRSGAVIYKPTEDNQDFVIIDFNHFSEIIEQTTKNAVLGKKVTVAFPNVKEFGLFDVFQRVNQTGKPERVPSSFYKDNRISGWRDNYVYKLPSGEIVAIYQDITKKKQTEEELAIYRTSLEKLVQQRTKELIEINKFNERIISTIPSALIVLDEELKITNANNRFYTLFEIPKDKKIIGNSLGKITGNLADQGKAKSSITLHLEAFITSDLKYSVFEDILVQEIHPNLQKICKFYISKMLKDKHYEKKENQILVAIEDTTKAKSMEQQLVQSERLVATGRLAASIAHEINNPLQGMSTHLDLMKDGLSEDTTKLKNYEHVKNNIKRIGEIVGQLLNIYRISAKDKMLVDINELLMQVISFIEHQMKNKRINLKLKLDPRLPRVSAWKQQLHQVFLNLILNAIESIEKSGTITLETSNEEGTVCIKIQDTGKGIKKDIAEHIFDPFFSTKTETGVGLGLFVCKGLIENHKGKIFLETKEGKGTTFTIKIKGEK